MMMRRPEAPNWCVFIMEIRNYIELKLNVVWVELKNSHTSENFGRSITSAFKMRNYKPTRTMIADRVAQQQIIFSSLIDALQRNRRERDIFFIHKNSCSLYTPNATLIVIVVFIWVHIMNLCAGMLFKTSVMNWSFRRSSWKIKCCTNNLFYYFYFEGARYHDGKSLSVKS